VVFVIRWVFQPGGNTLAGNNRARDVCGGVDAILIFLALAIGDFGLNFDGYPAARFGNFDILLAANLVDGLQPFAMPLKADHVAHDDIGGLLFMVVFGDNHCHAVLLHRVERRKPVACTVFGNDQRSGPPLSCVGLSDLDCIVPKLGNGGAREGK